MKSLTTRKAAEAVGIAHVTLNVWIARRKVKAPKPVIDGGVAKRLWTARDLAHLRETKARIFGKGRGRKAKK